MPTLATIGHTLPGLQGSVIREWRQKEQLPVELTLQSVASDGSKTPIDITAYTFSATAQYYTVASVTQTVGDFGAISLDGEFMPISGQMDKDLSSSITKHTDATTGKFTMQIPGDLYEGTISPNSNANVPIAVIYIRIDNNETSATEFTLPYILVMRHGV